MAALHKVADGARGECGQRGLVHPIVGAAFVRARQLQLPDGGGSGGQVLCGRVSGERERRGRANAAEERERMDVPRVSEKRAVVGRSE